MPEFFEFLELFRFRTLRSRSVEIWLFFCESSQSSFSPCSSQFQSFFDCFFEETVVPDMCATTNTTARRGRLRAHRATHASKQFDQHALPNSSPPATPCIHTGHVLSCGPTTPHDTPLSPRSLTQLEREAVYSSTNTPKSRSDATSHQACRSATR